MKLTFLGTRGNIEARTRRHRMHSALRVSYRGRTVIVDCGADWRGRLAEMGPGPTGPRAVVVTHAHPDHVGGLRDGVSCPVYATDEAWDGMGRSWDIPDRRRVEPRRPFEVRGIRFEAFPVEHSLRAPAVGYRIAAGEVTVFYVPDLVHIHDRSAALAGCDAYIGDGARLDRDLVRPRGDRLIGHVAFRTQLSWCGDEGVSRAWATHCGSQIVEGDERVLGARLRSMAEERGVEAEIATDGLDVILR